MKRMVLLAVFLSGSSGADSLFAQESAENELNLVRGLRAKGWYDLARDKVEELRKRNDPLLSASLPIEIRNSGGGYHVLRRNRSAKETKAASTTLPAPN